MKTEQKTNRNIASFPDDTAVPCGSAAALCFSCKSVPYGQTIRQVTEELHGTIILISVVFTNPQNHLNVVRNIHLCKYVVADLSLEK